MEPTLYFSETERTSQQRRTSVKFAVGVTMSQGGGISPALTALYIRYIAGAADLAAIDAELTSRYPLHRGDDPRYAPGQPTDRWQPNLNAPPSRPYGSVEAGEPAQLA